MWVGDLQLLFFSCQLSVVRSIITLMGSPYIFAGTINVAHALVLGLHFGQSLMERLDVQELMVLNQDFSSSIDIVLFLSDLDGCKPFGKTIGEVELWRNDGFSTAVNEAISSPGQPA